MVGCLDAHTHARGDLNNVELALLKRHARR
jgi:hypothetical protein